MAVKPIPDGYHTLTPYAVVDGAAEFLEFLKAAFNADIKFSMPMGDKVGHAELSIGNSMMMVADPNSEWPVRPAQLCLYVEDCDSAYKQAVKAGAITLSEPEDQFYGDRAARLTDKWGNNWFIHTHIKDVSMEDMDAAIKAMGE